MYNQQLSRREFLRRTVGTTGAVQTVGLYDRAIAAAGALGGLAGIVGSASDASARSHTDIRGIKEFREYVLKTYRQSLGGGVINHDTNVIFDNKSSGERVIAKATTLYLKPGLEITIWGDAPQMHGFENHSTYFDTGVKGFLGRDDVVAVNAINKNHLERANFYLNGGYWIERYVLPEDIKSCEVPGMNLAKCLVGVAEYNHAAQTPKPKLTRYYSKHATHEGLLERRRREIQAADIRYKRIVREIISKLEKEGKIKVA